MISPEQAQELVDKMSETNRLLRKQVHDIVLYSEGAFRVQELYQMPMYQLTEIVDSYKEKNEKEREAIESAQNKNTRKF